MLPCPGYGLGARIKIQFVENIVDVEFYRALTDIERCSDLLLSQPLAICFRTVCSRAVNLAKGIGSIVDEQC
jgi:hypothetical protein